ncbi:MAG: hypothetical protein V7645_2136 [Actinomycetota bacterium]
MRCARSLADLVLGPRRLVRVGQSRRSVSLGLETEETVRDVDAAGVRKRSRGSREAPGPRQVSPSWTASCRGYRPRGDSWDSQLVERRSVIALHCAVAPTSLDVVSDFAPSNHAEKAAIERRVTCCAPFFLARHRSRRLALTGRRAPRTLIQPPLGRDTERAILVDPRLPFEAGAIRVPNVAASRLVARVRRCGSLQQPVDAAFDPAHRRRRAPYGRLPLVAPLAAA